MNVEIPDPLQRFAEIVREPVYMVGGAVRNALLGLPRADLDAAGALLPEVVEARCREAGLPLSRVNRSLGTVGVVIGGETIEYTAFRAERYAPGGRHVPEMVMLGGSMEQDAARRDFTVNALYAGCADGRVHDPTGGLADLEGCTLRQASAGTLCSDALRILRMVRFACELGFAVDPDTFAAAKAHAGGLADIAPERRREEFDRILLCDARYPDSGHDAQRSVLRALRLLTALDAWPHLIPEMTDGRDQTQRPDHHKYTVMEHLFHTCAAAPPERVLRLAGLLHDIGKPACLAETGKLYLHDRIGEPIARRRLTALCYPNAVTDEVCALVRHHMYDVQGMAKESTLRTRFATWGRALTERLIVMREMDIRGCGTNTGYVNERWRALYARMCSDGTPFSEAELAIGGEEIMHAAGIGPGQRVGEIKRELFLHCARHPHDNSKKRLLALTAQMRRGGTGI